MFGLRNAPCSVLSNKNYRVCFVRVVLSVLLPPQTQGSEVRGAGRARAHPGVPPLPERAGQHPEHISLTQITQD